MGSTSGSSDDDRAAAEAEGGEALEAYNRWSAGKHETRRLWRKAYLDKPAADSSLRLAFRIGEQRYQVGDGEQFTLTESEDIVLLSLIDLDGAADKRQLILQSGKDDAPRVLKTIRDKYTQLEPHITCPGVKGKGGYQTTVRHAK